MVLYVSEKQNLHGLFIPQQTFAGFRFTLTILHYSLFLTSICVEEIGKLQELMWSGGQQLRHVYNPSVSTRRQQFTLCLSLLQLQLSLSPGEPLSELPGKTTTAKETFGHDRSSILCWFIFFQLASLPLIPSSALPFLVIIRTTSSPFFPLQFYAQHVTFACPFNPVLPIYPHFFPPLLSYLLLLRLTFYFSLPPIPPVSLYMPAKLPLPSTYLYPDSAANNQNTLLPIVPPAAP